MGEDEPKIIFDPNNSYKIRVMEPEQFDDTVKLRDSSKEFSGDVKDFMKAVNEFLEFMNAQSKKVEEQKLRSIALRNKVREEIDTRKRSQDDLKQVYEGKQKELEKINAEIRSYEDFDRQLTDYTEKLSLI